MKSKLSFIIAAILILCIHNVSKAQIGIGTTNPDNSSLLQLDSDTKGILFPTSSSGSMSAMSPAPNSLLVYNNDLWRMGYFHQDSAQWRYFAIGAVSPTSPFSFYDGLQLGINHYPTWGYRLDVKGNVNVSGSLTTSKKIAVTGNFTNTGVDSSTAYQATGTEGNAPAPSGLIIMWSGAANAIPAGWKICDGTRGTPDLRDKFIVGTGTSYTVSTSGGANSRTLSTANLPSHNHTVSWQADHTHNHGVGTMDGPTTSSNTRINNDMQDWDNTRGMHLTAPDYNYTGYAGGHNHTVQNSGSGGAFNNKPPYYALAFIMKK